MGPVSVVQQPEHGKARRAGVARRAGIGSACRGASAADRRAVVVSGENPEQPRPHEGVPRRSLSKKDLTGPTLLEMPD